MNTTNRKPARISHLTYVLMLERMLKGRFTPSDLIEASGLSKLTIWRLLRAMQQRKTVTLVDKLPRPPGVTGPRECQFELSQLAGARSA